MSDDKVKCRDCNVAAQIVQVDGKFKRVECPKCGLAVPYDKVMASLAEQAQYEMAVQFRKSFKGSKFVKPDNTPLRKPNGQLIFNH